MTPFANTLLVFQRYVSTTVDGEVSYTNGIPDAITPTDIPAWCCVNGREGDKINLNPEGRKSQSYRKIYTDTFIQMTNEESGLIADTVVIDGEQYVVHEVQPWTVGFLNHYEVKLVTN